VVASARQVSGRNPHGGGIASKAIWPQGYLVNDAALNRLKCLDRLNRRDETSWFAE
jgi:hypothetical protein